MHLFYFLVSAFAIKASFGKRTIYHTSESSERVTNYNHLGIKFLSDLRIWVGHFHQNDFIVTSNSDGYAVLDRVDFKTIKKYRDSDTGKSSLLAPPIPADTKSLVMNRTIP